MLYDSIAITQGQIWLHLHWEKFSNNYYWYVYLLLSIWNFVYDKT